MGQGTASTSQIKKKATQNQARLCAAQKKGSKVPTPGFRAYLAKAFYDAKKWRGAA